MQKYILLTQEAPLEDGRIVRRIQAVRDFGNVKRGDLGGFVEKADNLAHRGNCWIADDAIAAGWSRVSGDALLVDRARLDQHATAADRVVVGDDVLCDGYVALYGDCVLGAFTYLTDGVIVRDFASVFCRGRFSGKGKRRQPNLRDRATVCECATLDGAVVMSDSSTAAGHATLRNFARLRDDSYAGGFSTVMNSAVLCDRARALRHTTVGGRSILAGKAVASGDSVILGRSRLLCNVYVGGRVQVIDELLSGDTIRIR